MAVFEKVVHGNLKDVIQNTDMLLKEGKHKLDFRDEYSMTSKGMDVTVRIYQRYNVIPGNSTCITLLFQDNKDGDIKIAGTFSRRRIWNLWYGFRHGSTHGAGM